MRSATRTKAADGPERSQRSALLFAGLHDWTLEQCRFLAEKSFVALPSGGRLIVHELLLDSDKAGPVVPSLMSMVMLLWTEGRQYSGAELTELLQSVGFTEVRANQTFGSWGSLPV